MVAKTDKEKRQQILDALEGGGLTVNQLSAEVGFNARCIVNKMQMDGILQFCGEKITDPISGRGAKLVEICPSKDQAKILHAVLCGMVNRGTTEKRNGGG